MYANTFRMIVVCRGIGFTKIFLLRNIDEGTSPGVVLTLPGVEIRRIEAVIMKGRLFITYITTTNILFFTRLLISVDQDSTLSNDIFYSFPGSLS